jgi:DNA replication protein DnaC
MDLQTRLAELGLTWMAANLAAELKEAARAKHPATELLARLVHGECEARLARAVQRRIKAARLPVIKTLDGFDFSWPAGLPPEAIRHLFRLEFVRQKENVIFIGGVGLGKTHLAIALAHEACQRNLAVRFANAVDIVNALVAARQVGTLPRLMRQYTAPALLVLDELGYLPLDRLGADLLFQVISSRYERAATIITANRAYKDWTVTFANDATITSAILDRVTHHAHTFKIEGKSYRMRQRLKD